MQKNMKDVFRTWGSYCFLSLAAGIPIYPVLCAYFFLDNPNATMKGSYLLGNFWVDVLFYDFLICIGLSLILFFLCHKRMFAKEIEREICRIAEENGGKLLRFDFHSSNPLRFSVKMILNGAVSGFSVNRTSVLFDDCLMYEFPVDGSLKDSERFEIFLYVLSQQYPIKKRTP